MSLTLIMVLVFFTSLSIILLLLNIPFKDNNLIQSRLRDLISKGGVRERADAELNKPFAERVLYPILKAITKSFARFMPERRVLGLEQKLIYAGNPGNLSASEYLGIQYTFAFGLPFLTAAVFIVLDKNDAKVFLTSLILGVLGYYVPNLFLKSLASKRKTEIDKNLPDVLDLLTVSVEAGLGFDSALAKVSSKTKGPLAHEFVKVLQEIKMGKPRREALKDLSLRCQSDNLANFISSLIQADQLGVSIGNVLRLQSEQIRQAKRQRTQEQAMKAPVKMLIPLVLFIFPTLFIVLLGPAMIEIFTTLF